MAIHATMPGGASTQAPLSRTLSTQSPPAEPADVALHRATDPVQLEVDFVSDNPARTLFHRHRHRQPCMDFGFLHSSNMFGAIPSRDSRSWTVTGMLRSGWGMS